LHRRFLSRLDVSCSPAAFRLGYQLEITVTLSKPEASCEREQFRFPDGLCGPRPLLGARAFYLLAVLLYFVPVSNPNRLQYIPASHHLLLTEDIMAMVDHAAPKNEEVVAVTNHTEKIK
jgi:hypothetical protein